MKRTIFASLLMLLVAFCAQAQNYKVFSADNFSYGAKVGLTLADVTSFDGSPVLRGQVGIMAGYRLNKYLGVGAEVLYSGWGSASEVFMAAQGDDDRVHVNMNYVNVPFLVKFYPVSNLSIESGVSADFLVRSRINYRGDNSIALPYEDDGITMSIPIGVSYEFMNRFVVGLRYNLGVTDIFSELDFEGGRNRVASFSIGYLF